MQLFLSRDEEELVVNVHAILLLLRTTIPHQRRVGKPRIRPRNTVWALTSSHGYIYIPLRKPWNSRPFSIWFFGTGTGTFPFLPIEPMSLLKGVKAQRGRPNSPVRRHTTNRCGPQWFLYSGPVAAKSPANRFELTTWRSEIISRPSWKCRRLNRFLGSNGR